jgi:acetyl-CoA carboxylase biotin carboxyl carrier protein
MADEPRTEAAELLALVDRFEALLDGSELAELEVEAGTTLLRLARPVAPAAVMVAATGPGGPATADAAAADRGRLADERLHAVLAPLTGVYYGSPSPGAAPYVKEGGEVSTGQVIGLIEAMKLFNEIKSDVTGVVRRIVAENGALVKQKQPLIEVEPT